MAHFRWRFLHGRIMTETRHIFEYNSDAPHAYQHFRGRSTRSVASQHRSVSSLAAASGRAVATFSAMPRL
jgi:hypothetical protein